MPRLKAKDEDKSLYINFLKKAEEFMNAAKASLERQEYNAACSNAVHTVISGADALCVYFLGKRSSGDSHEESVGLFNSLPVNQKATPVKTWMNGFRFRVSPHGETL